jgi:hypothetical protein
MTFTTATTPVAGKTSTVDVNANTTATACPGCGKHKKGEMLLLCKCGKKCCIKHRSPELHACTFDYKKEHADLLAKQNQVVDHKKIELI